MRKRLITSASSHTAPKADPDWLNVYDVAEVEMSSEDPAFPIASALLTRKSSGWRAVESGKQTIRILFQRQRPLRRIRLEFLETELERSQEFKLGWSAEPNGPLVEIVRQQWNFSPQGSTSEVEDYKLDKSPLFSTPRDLA
jgi:hypothetical protein